MDNSKATATLNSLIQTCKDGEEGFRVAAEGITDPQTTSLFQELSRERGQMARALQSEVSRLGEKAETGGSVSGSLHRGWINIKSAVTGRDEAAIVAEAERGEDIAKKAYEDALRADLPASARTLVQEQSARVHGAHDRVRALERATSR